MWRITSQLSALRLVETAALEGISLESEIQKQIDTDACASVPKKHRKWLVENIPFVVDREGKYGFNEAYLGLGYLWSTTDYGEAMRMSDEELISEVKQRILSDWLQYTAVSIVIKRVPNPKYPSLHISIRKLCNIIVISVSRMGYAPKAVLA